MFVFESNSRVQITEEGIRFYEPDVLCSGYSFSGNQKMELKIDYTVPGFGIVMVEENGKDIQKAFNAYLFKIGINDFRGFTKRFDEQQEFHVESCMMEPSQKNIGIRLLFELNDNIVTLKELKDGETGEEHRIPIGEAKLPRTFTKFRFGIYSCAGNILRSIKIIGNVPPHWQTSIKNTDGGRIAFFRDEFRFENCEHRAELGQDNIPLKKGKYWLRYETEPINGEMDIKAFILKPQDGEPVVDPPNTENPREFLIKDSKKKQKYERNLEDHYKNILQEDGSFVLEHASDVWLKFQGHNGIAKKICIIDNPKSSFVETWDKQVSQDGSRIRIRLKGLKRVEWRAIVYDVPDWTDMTKPCPYGILDLYKKRYTLLNLGIDLNKEYRYVYQVQESTLEIYDTTTWKRVHASKITLDSKDHNKLSIMYNVTMTLYSLVLTDEYDNSIDVVNHRTYKKFVPANISGPIIVTDDETDIPFNLSSSYREAVMSRKTISLFSKGQPLLLQEDIPVNSHSIAVYGIPRGAYINAAASSIEKFSDKYAVVSTNDYRYGSNIFEIDEKVWNLYDYIAVEYQSLKDYMYEFTNYAREVFDGGTEVLDLEEELLKNNSDIIIYGIPEDTKIYEDYLYRIPSRNMVTSIDYYADDYDVIPEAVFIVDYEHHEIRLNPEISKMYQKIVVDYLKGDSYAINYRSQYAQYEVDISTDKTQVTLHTDMHEDGAIYDYIRTVITPDKEKYVVLERKEDADIEDSSS